MRVEAIAAAALLAGLISSSAVVAEPDAAHIDDAPLTAPAFIWAGAYAGVHFGRAYGESSAVDFGAPVVDGAFACASAAIPYCGMPFDYDGSGWVSGVQLGYNWLRGDFLLGIEGDLGRLDLNGDAIRHHTNDEDAAAFDYGWYGILAARLGLPVNRALFYLKAGAALAETRMFAADRDEAFVSGSGLWYVDLLGNASDHGIETGWALGGGLEYALSASWSVKVEYLYLNFGSNILTDADGDRYKLTNDVHTVKLGLNYHLNGVEVEDALSGQDAAPGAPPLWDGRYLGVHIASAHTNTSTIDYGAPVGDGAFACFANGNCGQPFDINASGWMTGVEAGESWQRGRFVFGIEGDLGRIDLQKQATTRNANDDRDAAGVDYGWYGAATARVGVPFRRALIYVKGGLAVAEITNTAADLDKFTVPAGDAYYVDPLSPTRKHRIEAGWALGGGVEYTLSRAWRLKAEYLYMDFGSERSLDPDGDTYQHDNALHVVKLGLNYNLSAADAPLR